MLCSISTGKSGSNWLDRLRSSKGFPTGDNLDLDHFLTNPNPSDSPTTNASNSPNSNSESTYSNDKQLENQKAQPLDVASSDPAGGNEWLGIMSDVLSELFNIGDQAQTSRKKASRKQINPRICIIKAPDAKSGSVRKDENVHASTASLDSREETNREEEEEEMEKGERELLGFSRSEVTVIDTSCEVWKVDKFIFRKNNTWKVKDKKGKSRTFGRKKRKAPLAHPPLDASNVVVCNNKKQKILNLELRSLKETSGRECGLPANDDNAPGDRVQNVYSETAGDLTQALRKRLPRKSRKGSASVTLVKSTPTGKKNGAKLVKNGPKDTRSQYKA